MTRQAPRLEQVSCNLCGANQTDPVFFCQGYHVVRCKKCSLTYVNPQNTRERLSEIYDNEYFESAPDRPYYKNYYAEREWRSREFSKVIAELEKFKKPGRLLDIGAAAGFLLDAARQRGWETHGIEISKTASDFARKELKLDVRTGELLEAEFPEGSFDAITMVDVIEHVKDPAANIQKAAKLLKTGGVMVFSTPNIDAWAFKIFGTGWVFMVPEVHLWYFNPKTLSKMLECNGLKVLQVQYPYFDTPYFNPKELWNLVRQIFKRVTAGKDEIVKSAPMRGSLMTIFCQKG